MVNKQLYVTRPDWELSSTSKAAHFDLTLDIHDTFAENLTFLLIYTGSLWQQLQRSVSLFKSQD